MRAPTHLRAPPPKGMKAKLEATSLGYRLLPCASGRYPVHAPPKAGFELGSLKRSGRNSSGSRHRCGDLRSAASEFEEPL